MGESLKGFNGDTQQRYRAIARGVVLKKEVWERRSQAHSQGSNSPPIPKVASKIMVNQAFDVSTKEHVNANQRTT